jgi:hypothetical protein
VQGAAADTLYDPLELTAKLDAIGGTLDTCLLGQDIPAGSAPPVWHLAVTPEGQVRSVRSAVGEWPIAAVNCVTRALTDVHLGATRSHDGGQLVLTFGPR